MSPELPLQVVTRIAPGSLSGSRPSWWLRLLLISVILGSIAAAIYWQSSTAADSRGVDSATQQPLASRSVFALGILEPQGRVISVAAPSGAGEARIESLRVTEGAEVQQGDVLAVLDNEARLKVAVKIARDQVDQAQLQIDRTMLEVRTTRAQLFAAAAAAKARLATSEGTFQRQQELSVNQATSKELLDLAELEFVMAQEQLNEAQAKLDRYEVPEGEELVDIELARLEWVAAQSSLAKAEAELETAYVKAPADGTILRLNLQAGERIGQTALLEMGATDQMMVLVEVYESEVPRVHVGQSVTLTASPLQRPLRGTVTRVSQLVRRQEIVESTPAANTDARIVEVWVTLESESSLLASQFVQLQVRAEFLP